MVTNIAIPSYQQIWCVVLNWKNWDATEMCIQSVSQSSSIASIVIVDNESDSKRVRTSPTNVATTRIAGTPCVVIASKANRGFAAGVNLGIEYAIQKGATAILLLNNDVVVGPASIQKMADAMAKDETIGAVGAWIRFPSQDGGMGAVQCRGGGFVSSRVGNVVQSRQAGDRLDYLTGACMLIRKELAAATKGFDERYFMYWEDVAFGFKTRELGYRIVVVDDAYAEHVLSSSRDKAGNLLEAYESWSAMEFASHDGMVLRLTVAVRQLLSCCMHMLAGRPSVASAKFNGIRFWTRHREVSQAYTVVGELRARMGKLPMQ